MCGLVRSVDHRTRVLIIQHGAERRHPFGTVRLARLIGQSRALDMVLTGRPVTAPEAYAFGLANRLTPPGEALRVALELARELAALPQRCLRSDRLSLLTQWGLGEDEAMRQETRLGLDVLRSGESQSGAAAFAAGAGRHGGRGGKSS